MKKIIGFLILAASLGCSSEFDFQEQPRQEYTIDEDGDPVIKDPEKTDPFYFGAFGGSCYGYETPDAEVAVIQIEDIMPPSHDLSEFLPEIGNQGTQGSCTAWAAGYYLKSFQENYENLLNGEPMDNEMSPSFIYNQIKAAGCDNGSNVQRALDTIVSLGIPQLDEMPYDDDDCETQPNDLQKSQALPNRIQSYSYLNEKFVLEQAKAFLLKDQPIVIAIAIDANYFGARDEFGNFVYRKFKKAVGGHAMLVVGYDDDMNAFKVVNSWGKGWGNDGFVWIDYKAFKEAGQSTSDFQILCEAWVTEDIIQI